MKKSKYDGAFLRLIQGLFLFNVADALLSVQLISNEKILEEANPLWGDLLTSSPFTFLTIKLLIASAVCGFFYLHRDKTITKVGIVVTFLTYMALICSFYFFVFL